MDAYLNIVKRILSEGAQKENRTGISTIAVSGAIFEHDMQKGFPLITTKQVPFRLIASELEFFIKGITNKSWLIERNNHIWDEWCSPDKVPYGYDVDTRKKMKAEVDLGPVYGWQWRNFGAEYAGHDKAPQNQGIDQLKAVIDKLKTDPTSRRMIVSAWNPVDIMHMALPPCHYSFQIIVIGNKLNLLWNQRSADAALGLPFNIACYGLLLHLLAKESGFEEGKLTGFLGDTHIYDSHIKGLKMQIARTPFKLPIVKTNNFKSLFNWEYTDSVIENYQFHPKIDFEVAI